MAIFTVTTLIDENDGIDVGEISLRDAINAANATPEADEIVFDTSSLESGTITLVNGELVVTRSVTITGLGADSLAIDANDNSRVFNIDDGDNTFEHSVVIDGLTITGGSEDTLDGNGFEGGGIRNHENLTLRNSVVTGHRIGEVSGAPGGYLGGGIWSRGTLTVSNSIIHNNRAFAASYPANGAGIWSSGTLIINDSTVSNNFAYGIDGSQGGGIWGSGTVSIANSTINNNTTRTYDSSADGGGLLVNGTLTLVNSTVSENLADDYSYAGGGGGITIWGTGNSVVSNSTISGNTSTSSGGGIDNEGTLTVVNSTITGNTSFMYGGGIISTRTVVVNNSIIAGNKAADDSYVPLQLDVSGTFSSNGANVIGDTTGSTGFSNNESFAGLGINNISEVIDPTLADNGGPTETHALAPGSPAIDGGINADAVDADRAPLNYDQRGSGFDRIINDSVDIGAFESSSDPNAFFFSGKGDTTVNGLTFADEDIVRFDGASFDIVFDGSNLLPRNAQINAFDIVSDEQILLSFAKPVNIPGLGKVSSSSVVKFTVESLGRNNTSGRFETYLDGSNIGLDEGSENIDALTQMEDGSLLFSTVGDANLPGGIFSKDTDLLRFNPNALGSSVSVYFDGSDVGLSKKAEDVSAVSVRNNELLFSTKDTFRVPGRGGRDEDAFTFKATSTGTNTAGSFDRDLFFDGSQFNFTGDISGIDFSAG